MQMTWHDFWDLLQISAGDKDTDGDIDKGRSLSLLETASWCSLQHSVFFSLCIANLLGLPYMLWVRLSLCHSNPRSSTGPQLNHASLLPQTPSTETLHITLMHEQIWKCEKVHTPWDNSFLMGDKTAGWFQSASYMEIQRVPNGPSSVIHLIAHPGWVFSSSLLCLFWNLSPLPCDYLLKETFWVKSL